MQLDKNPIYVTLTSLDNYVGVEFFKPGQTLILEKEKDSDFDDESFEVYTETKALVGYVANSVSSVARGTHSAGYLTRFIEMAEDNHLKCKVLFVLEDKAVAEIL